MGVVLGCMLVHFFPNQSLFRGPLNLVNIQKNLNFVDTPFLGGRGKNFYGGVRVVPGYMYVFFSQIKSYLAIHLLLIRFPPTHPLLIRPWGTSLHKRLEFFIAHIFVDTLRNPNLPKSAYPYFY